MVGDNDDRLPPRVEQPANTLGDEVELLVGEVCKRVPVGMAKRVNRIRLRSCFSGRISDLRGVPLEELDTCAHQRRTQDHALEGST